MFSLIRQLWANLTRLNEESAGLAEDFALIRRGLRNLGVLPSDNEIPALPAPESNAKRRK
jgi:hypothetical protein